MFLRKLALQNFRNFTNQHWDFAKTTIFVGENGSGKTSIIEAINLLATGDSFRAARIEEMIRLEAELSRVQGLFTLSVEKDLLVEKNLLVKNEKSSDDLKLETMLTRGMVAGKKSQYRLFTVNDVRRRRKDFVKNLSVVVFRPEDLRLIEGSPRRRRLFLDQGLSMLDWKYQRALQQYEKTLKRRNLLLQKVREGEESKSILSFWNLNLLKHGEFLQRERSNFVDFIREVIFPFELNIEYLPSLINEDRLKKYADKEIAAGHTLIGPHKDDFLVKFSLPEKGIEDLSILAYGSRGQQRLAVLWLKVAELQFLHSRIDYQPLLLLDDIMSELDENSKTMVLSLLENYQVVLTTADEDLAKELSKKVQQSKLIRLSLV
ncbi:MAG: DNA replication and repair protein RecF [Candidatus Pacebacteria bacterium]|nr:DNA replication and repair protein RecF [Candidatus Paceibacterota bacterium]